jgi:general L-amino acid transport system permease protein
MAACTILCRSVEIGRSGRSLGGAAMRRATARDLLLQALVIAAVAAIVWFFWGNAVANMAKRGFSPGFDFLARPAGFDFPFHVVDWQVTFTYGWALWVSFLNTIIVSLAGVLAATVLGLVVGVMRLSRNWLVRTTARAFVELIRNTPQLLQIVFWYVGVLQLLPLARDSIVVFGDTYLNNRGLYLPLPILAEGSGPAAGLVLAATVGAALIGWAPGVRRARLGAVRVIYLLPMLPIGALFWFGLHIVGWDVPALRGFNFRGGVRLPPEFVALWLGLSIYAAAFIAEIVRASILGVPIGQIEAAQSLGLRPARILRLVVLPQALRIMLPPMTSQYLNIIKSSSLGAAVAYPEIVQIFAGTVLNQSGRAIEVMLIVMAIFLVINLVTSAGMNWLNRRVALVER